MPVQYTPAALPVPLATPVYATADKICYLPCSISKPLLIEYCQIDSEKRSLEPLANTLPLLQRNQATIVAHHKSLENAHQNAQQVLIDRKASIKRNEDPTFFRKLWRWKAAREAKVQQQRSRLPEDETSAAKTLADKNNHKPNLDKINLEVSNATGAAQRSITIEQRKSIIQEEVVGLSPPSSALLSARNARSCVTSKLQQLQQLLNQVNQLSNMFCSAISQYESSLQSLRCAASENYAAEREANFECIEGDAYERRLQEMRNEDVTTAINKACSAHQIVNSAYSMIPIQSRQLFPGVAIQLGMTPIPQLRLENTQSTSVISKFFLGSLGDKLNDREADRQIQRDMCNIESCLGVARAQRQQTEQLIGAISGSVAGVQAEILSYATQEANAKLNMFNSILIAYKSAI